MADPAARFGRAVDSRPADRRARDLRVYGPPKRHTARIWLAIAVVGAVLFVVLIRGVLHKTRWTAVGDAAAVFERIDSPGVGDAAAGTR